MAVYRSSVLALFALATSGCIIAEPPTRTSLQTPPFLDLASAIPVPTEIVRVQQNESKEFKIPLRSEDDGDELWWALHENYGFGAATSGAIESSPIPDSTLDDTTREIRHVWNAGPLPPRCLQLTFVVCHRATYDFVTDRCTDPDDRALATYWVNVGDVTATPTLAECPTQADAQ